MMVISLELEGSLYSSIAAALFLICILSEKTSRIN